MLRLYAPRQGTLLTRALSRDRSKWVPGRTVKTCVFEWFRVPKMTAGLYARRGVEMAYERRGPVIRGYLCVVGRMALRARYQTINLTFMLTVRGNIMKFTND